MPDHGTGEAQQFYAALPAPARIGMEASGRTHWFERMLAEQGHELWVGEAAQIRAGVVRKQKTDRRLLQQGAARSIEHGRGSNHRQKTRPSSGLAVGVASESRRPKTV